eukprot:1169591-Rhodomonas_salina.1
MAVWRAPVACKGEPGVGDLCDRNHLCTTHTHTKKEKERKRRKREREHKETVKSALHSASTSQTTPAALPHSNGHKKALWGPSSVCVWTSMSATAMGFQEAVRARDSASTSFSSSVVARWCVAPVSVTRTSANRLERPRGREASRQPTAWRVWASAHANEV